MLTVYSGYVKGCRKSLSCKSGFKLSTRDQLFEGHSKALNLGFFFMCSYVGKIIHPIKSHTGALVSCQVSSLLRVLAAPFAL